MNSYLKSYGAIKTQGMLINVNFSVCRYVKHCYKKELKKHLNDALNGYFCSE